jgi:hypothetical protein
LDVVISCAKIAEKAAVFAENLGVLWVASICELRVSKRPVRVGFEHLRQEDLFLDATEILSEMNSSRYVALSGAIACRIRSNHRRLCQPSPP